MPTERDQSADPIPAKLKAGIKLGHYSILSRLGTGGMGEVWLAEDSRLGRKVAVKPLLGKFASDPERLRRFETEARAASATNHPNIVTIFEIGNSNGISFIAQEFVDGETLRSRLARGPIPLIEALDISYQVANALATAHGAGIIHRDIKPENIMLRHDGFVKVLDFGLAKLNEARDDSAQEAPSRTIIQPVADGPQSTLPGVVLGTVAYMSPEQARGEKVDARSDIWSLGVVLYEMLVGQRPFPGQSIADIFVAILERQPKPLELAGESVQPQVQQLLDKLLCKSKDERYQSSTQLAAELKRLHRRVELDEEREFSASSESQTRVLDAAQVVSNTRPKKIQTGVVRSRVAFLALGLVAAIGLFSYFFYPRLASPRRIDSIAVLPFDNKSGESELNKISEGISERLIDRLSELPQLKVISRNSSFKFRGSNIDPRQVAAQLGVAAILTGQVERQGDELRIRFDVVDAANDRQIAGGNFQQKPANLLQLQNEIVQAASQKLSLLLSDSQAKRLTENPTENSDAYGFYLSGLVELNSPQDFQDGKLEYSKALELFEQAVKRDPEFAAAYSEIAWVYWSQANGNGNPHELMPKAKLAATRAISIDPKSAKAHVVMATVNEYDFDWKGAEKEYLKAIELSPNLDFAHINYAYFLSVMGRHQEALAELEQLRIRDPINQKLNLLWKVSILSQARKFDEALTVYQEAQKLEKDSDVKPFALGYVYAGKMMYPEAARYYKKAVDLVGGEGKYSQPLIYLAATYAKLPEKRGEAISLLKRMETGEAYASPALLAIVYAALGDNDKAMELLDRAYVDKDLLLRFIKTGYEYDGLRTDRRFISLITRIGLGN